MRINHFNVQNLRNNIIYYVNYWSYNITIIIMYLCIYHFFIIIYSILQNQYCNILVSYSFFLQGDKYVLYKYVYL